MTQNAPQYLYRLTAYKTLKIFYSLEAVARNLNVQPATVEHAIKCGVKCRGYSIERRANPYKASDVPDRLWAQLREAKRRLPKGSQHYRAYHETLNQVRQCLGFNYTSHNALIDLLDHIKPNWQGLPERQFRRYSPYIANAPGVPAVM